MESRSRRRLLLAGTMLLLAVVGYGFYALAHTPATTLRSIPATVAGASENLSTASAVGPAATDDNARRRRPDMRVSAAAGGMPPPGTPITQIYDELRARAEAGDALAASRLYGDVHDCVSAKERLPGLREMADLMLNNPDGQDAPKLERREEQLASVEKRIAQYEAILPKCAGATAQQLQLTPLALRAAQLGDNAAADCYLSADMFAADGLLDHPEWLTQYKQNALDVANGAIEHGDWIMTVLLEQAYAVSPDASLLHQVTGHDLAIGYRYARLQQLGANGTNAQLQAAQDDRVAHMSEKLSAAEIEAGERWAQDAYARYFSANPLAPALDMISICE